MRLIILTLRKVCKDCGISKSISEFYPAGIYLSSYCKLCHRIRSVADERNRPTNKERVREKQRRRRALKRNNFVANVIEPIIFERDDGICGLCGLYVDPNNWHVDHILPLSKGGTHEPSNVQVAHPTCNLRKGNVVGWSAWTD